MKALYLAAVVVGAMSVALAQVSPEDHAAHHPDQAATGKAATPTKKAAPTSATPSAKTAPADVTVTDMQARMESMQELMDKLGQTKDPAERARLLAQHRRAMHEQLASMQHMGCPMMGENAGNMNGAERPGMTDKGMPGKEGGGMMSQGMMNGGMMSADMMKCREMMQARMDMMVGMMDQMMRHEEAQDAPTSDQP